MRNMQREKQKKFEFSTLVQFLRAAGISAEILDWEGEAPDILIRTASGVVGVEVTELFRDPGKASNSVQAQEAIADRIVSRANQIHARTRARPVHVSVHFSSSSDVRRLRREETAQALVDLVASRALKPGDYFHWNSDQDPVVLPDAICSVGILGMPKTSMSHWTAPRSGWVAPMPSESLQFKVDEKARHLPDYRQRARTIWLLLVSEGGRPSQFFDPPSREVAISITSPFDRTFYLSRFRNLVVELGV